MSDEPKKQEIPQEVMEAVRGLLGPYMEQREEGFNRVARLVELAERLSAPEGLQSIIGRDAKDAAQDVLRAAVVLTHAHLEEFLRTIARVFLPEGDEACLNEIPLAGLRGRRQNFLLGKLVQHRGKSVDELIRASVDEYLERSNYNSTEEISVLLESLGFLPSGHSAEFAAIQQMIERRHQIVHRADRFETAKVAALTPIAAGDVSRWLTSTHEFMKSLYIPLLMKLVNLASASDQNPE